MNRLWRGIERVEKENQKIYKEGKENHERKVRFIREKVCNTPEIHKQNQNEWIKQVAKGDGREKVQKLQNVPVYGDVEAPLDRDEVAAASLPSDFAMLGKITLLQGTF